MNTQTTKRTTTNRTQTRNNKQRRTSNKQITTKSNQGEDGPATNNAIDAANTPPEPYNEPETKVKVMSPMAKETERAGLIVEDPINTQDPGKQKIYVTVDDPKNPLGITRSADHLS